MRKLLLVGTGALGLTLAGLALAGTLNTAKSVRSVAGTFTATTVSHSQTRSCTTVDNKTIASMFPEEMHRTVNYTITPGTYLRRPTP